jgi:hypothetical protein
MRTQCATRHPRWSERVSYAIGLVPLLWSQVAGAQAVAWPTRFTTGGRDIVNMTFGSTPVGELPTGLKLLSGTVDVVDVNGTHMLRASSQAELELPLPQVLPQDFSVEIELIPKQCCNPQDIAIEGTSVGHSNPGSSQITWHRNRVTVIGGGDSFAADMPDVLANATPGMPTVVTVVMQGPTLKLYTNGRRLYTLSDRKFVRAQKLWIWLGGQDDNKYAVYVARIRVVDNAPPAGPLNASNPPPAPPGSGPGSQPAAGSASQPATGTTPAPTRLTWSVRVNNQPLQTTEVQSLAAPGQGSPRDYLILVDELAAAMASTMPDAQLQIRGQTLTSVFGVGPRPPASGTGASAPLTGSAVDSLDNFVFLRSQVSISIAPLTLQAAGVLSRSVTVINGRAYVPLSDVTTALGGTAAIGAGQVDISGASTCSSCLVRPP